MIFLTALQLMSCNDKFYKMSRQHQRKPGWAKIELLTYLCNTHKAPLSGHSFIWWHKFTSYPTFRIRRALLCMVNFLLPAILFYKWLHLNCNILDRWKSVLQNNFANHSWQNKLIILIHRKSSYHFCTMKSHYQNTFVVLHLHVAWMSISYLVASKISD